MQNDAGQAGFLPGWLQAVLIGRNPRFTVIRILTLVAGSYLLFGFILRPIRVFGPSMLPTYHERSINFVNRLAYLFHEPRRGDVVSIRYAGEHLMLMKRIVGLPGETLEFHNGHLLINGRRLAEPYVKYSCDWEMDPIKLGSDQYFVVGDNRSMDIHDHKMGPAPRYRIVGKVLL